MYQVWSKSIEGCWFYSVHKDGTEGRTDGNVTISLRNFVGEGVKSAQSKMDNPEKLETWGTQDDEKQNKNATQYALDTTIPTQTQIT